MCFRCSWRMAAQCRKSARPGMPIGMFESPSLAVTSLDPRPGDTLVLFTDRVTEARTAAGSFRPLLLTELLERNRGALVPALTADIVQAVERLQDGWPRDDIAVVAMRWLAPARPD